MFASWRRNDAIGMSGAHQVFFCLHDPDNGRPTAARDDRRMERLTVTVMIQAEVTETL
jgi:hypothetical protein